jgi:23S rRNA (cytosine1962-C5)-methyltransferase
MSEGIITIRKDREKPIRNQHPWIFSGAIAKAENAEDGDIVTVVDHRGHFLARGYWNHQSQIQVRILTWQDEPIDEAWWRKMLKRAIDNRYPRPQYNVGNRIINAENDFIPGLIVDRYSNFLVLQALTLHIDQKKHKIAEILVELFSEARMPIYGVYERSDVDVRSKEGLQQVTGVLWGKEPPELVLFGTEKLSYLVDIRNGHKTGYYLDQLENHHILADLLLDNDLHAPDANLLNAFCYTGGFGFASVAKVVNVDASELALKLAEKNYETLEFPMEDVQFIQADVFEYLRDCVERGDQYDLVILDPPKFAHNNRQVDKAARGYKDINLNAFKIIKSGGYLMTFSCSGAISRDLFQKIVFGALADSGRQAQIIKHLSASDDHPVALTFPEGEYLKGLLLRVY